MMSNDLFRKRVFPLLDKGEKVFMIVFDNLRYDQWRMLYREIAGIFSSDEELYFSILPTATQYARNAIFAGLMPLQIEEIFPGLWVDESENEGKNLKENELIATQLARFRRKNSFSYSKVNDSQAADRLLAQFSQLERNDLNVLVVNFIDILSHARTEQKTSERTCGRRSGVSQYNSLVVQAQRNERAFQKTCRQRFHRCSYHRSRKYSRGTAAKGYWRQRSEHQSALQARKESEIQCQGGFRHTPSRRCRTPVAQSLYFLHFCHG